MTLSRLPLIFLMGPTASGKTDLALRLAQAFHMEIVNADSVQVYRGLEIGSAKPSLLERAAVKHHLLDVVEPDEPFSVGRYHQMALEVIQSCQARGGILLFVGGSGLYFRAVEQGLAATPPVPEEIYQQLILRKEQEGLPALHQFLCDVDPVFAAKVTVNDWQRIRRGLGVYLSSGFTLTEWQQRQLPGPHFPILKLAMHWPREILYARIEARFDQMMALGLLEEVRTLASYQRNLPALKAVGYRQLLRHIDGELTLQQAIALGKQESRRYAKRQLTWFNREANLFWFSPDEPEKIIAHVSAFLSQRDFK
ncbi:MAG: tRNA (adenosine(37)-N6)-dimethylallyltransferase MiaA [Magnetococcus sp. DMHC-6]